MQEIPLSDKLINRSQTLAYQRGESWDFAQFRRAYEGYMTMNAQSGNVEQLQEIYKNLQKYDGRSILDIKREIQDSGRKISVVEFLIERAAGAMALETALDLLTYTPDPETMQMMLEKAWEALQTHGLVGNEGKESESTE